MLGTANNQQTLHFVNTIIKINESKHFKILKIHLIYLRHALYPEETKTEVFDHKNYFCIWRKKKGKFVRQLVAASCCGCILIQTGLADFTKQMLSYGKDTTQIYESIRKLTLGQRK